MQHGTNENSSGFLIRAEKNQTEIVSVKKRWKGQK